MRTYSVEPGTMSDTELVRVYEDGIEIGGFQRSTEIPALEICFVSGDVSDFNWAGEPRPDSDIKPQVWLDPEKEHDPAPCPSQRAGMEA